MELETLKKIISEVLDVSTEDIDGNTSFTEDLGADSLEVFRIIMGVEDVFDIEFKPEEQKKISTVEDAVNFIRKALK